MLKAKKIIAVLFVIAILMVGLVVPVSADTIGLTINMNKPRADNYSGYVEYLLNDNGKMYARTTFWHFSLDALTNGQENIFPEVRVTVSNNRIVLTAFTNDNDPLQSRNFNWIVGNVNSVDGGSGSDYHCYNLDTTGAINAYWGNAQIMGYKIYGNGVNWDSSLSSGTYNWNIMYSETSMLYELILSMAQSSANSSGSITQNATDNANKIQQNQNENTDKIVNNQNELYDKEKDDITNSGNSSSESVEDIPNQSDGFLKSLSKLTNAMSYNGTECKWKLPNVYIPAISNIVPRIDLISEKDIDFGYWVEKIPNNILDLIRAVCTLALIVFCFKELYNTISYVLTLKGGNN
jgi:hypothetical protein